MDIRFIILIIFAVIWVIGNVLRAQQEEPKTPPARRPPPRPNPNPNQNQNQNQNQNNETAQSNRSPQPVSDIDRFLQEIDRMRRRGTEEAETAKSPPPPPKPKPVPQPQQRPPQTKKSPSSTGDTGRQPKQAKQAKQAPRQPREQQQPQSHTPSTAQRQPGDLAMELDLAEAKIVEPETPREVEAKFIAAPSQAPGGKAGTSTAGSATQGSSTAGTTTSTKFPEKRRSNKPAEGSPAELLKALLKSNKGVTVAFVLGEIFGSPKCKQNAAILPPAPMEETSEQKPA